MTSRTEHLTALADSIDRLVKGWSTSRSSTTAAATPSTQTASSTSSPPA